MYIRGPALSPASKRQSQRSNGCVNDGPVNQRLLPTMVVSTTSCVNDGCINRDIGGRLATAGM